MIIDDKRFLEIIPDELSSHVKEVWKDLWIALVSRYVSVLARREVLTGKAKFGITGDGKELAQLAMARAFKKGDFRSGYYRGQTFMFALGLATVEDYFAQLYADVEYDPFSGGRQMNNHFATRMIDSNGDLLDLANRYNVVSGISSTAGQVSRSMGLAMASKKYRKEQNTLDPDQKLSKNGNEVCFCTIGDASTSEGIFFETINAACVHKVPIIFCVWDDGYGISVPISKQTTKSSISEALAGFQLDKNGEGMHIHKVQGWDYPNLVATFESISIQIREEHRPALIHVDELTQPQGHSTSGSHERYKSKDRLAWEKEYDCILKMQEWMLENGLITEEQLDQLQDASKQYVREKKNNAWKRYRERMDAWLNEGRALLKDAVADNPEFEQLLSLSEHHKTGLNLTIADIVQSCKRAKLILRNTSAHNDFDQFLAKVDQYKSEKYHTHLYSDSPKAADKIEKVDAEYHGEIEYVNGFKILNHFFDQKFKVNPKLLAFGEDVGHIGDVNQGFAGLQKKYGEDRIFDTGIREWTIVGTAIGLALRGFRPIAEIQYLDYIFYGLAPLVDDLSCMRYRSNNLQAAPVIIRTRGHRLEGIWHTGSPIAVLLNSLKGMCLCVPRNMVQAAGMYNTLLESDDPAIVIESLNGYRLKEAIPSNLAEFKVALGEPEILIEGNDVTLVTYGSCVRIAKQAVKFIQQTGVTVELIDVQTLIPFDVNQTIRQSLEKTSRIIFLDEDVPGGATAFMMQKVLEDQDGYELLDAKPICITARDNRTPYGSDGDYFNKPNVEDVLEVVFTMLKEVYPDY